MGTQSIGVETVRHAHSLRVVGNSDVFQPTLFGRFCHFQDRSRAIGSRGVHVQVAADIRRFDQIKPGNALMYYPEANTLVPRHVDPKSKTPAFKGVVVEIVAG